MLLKWTFGVSLILMLGACMSGPDAPVPHSESIDLHIQSDSEIFDSIDTILMQPEWTRCFKAIADPDSFTAQLQFQWIIDGQALEQGDSLCLYATSADVGHWTLDVLAEDSVGNQVTWHFPLLVNSIPQFSLLASHFAPIHGITVPYLTGRGVQFVWKVFDPDPQDTIRIELQWKNSSDSLQSTYTYDLTGILLSNQSLAPSETYSWRVIATDRWGSADSTEWFSFVTDNALQIPGAVIGRVSVPPSTDLSLVRVLAFASIGDTVSTSLLPDSSFILLPGYFDEDIQIQAIIINSAAKSNIDLVDLDPLAPKFLVNPLEFP